MTAATAAPESSVPPSPRGWFVQPVMAGMLAACVGYASTFSVVLAGLVAAGATPSQAGSGLLCICLLQGVLNIVVAWRSKVPLSLAWSTPGAAFLLSSGALAGGFATTVGAFIMTAVLIIIAGLWKPFARAVGAIPGAIASAMLAGVLVNLCLAPVRAVAELPWQTLPIILVWALGLRFARRYAVPLAVLATILILVLTTHVPAETFSGAWPRIVPVMPVFSLDAFIRLSIPLFIITMASQNLPGLAVMSASGYEVNPGPQFTLTGAASALGALGGGLTINLAAITAAICAGPEAHPDKNRRWPAPIASGCVYLVLGPLAGLAAAFIAAVPPVLIQAVAGLALFMSLAGALAAALQRDDMRLPAIVTFITAASGVTILSIGGAFWGLLAGIGLSLLLRDPRRP